VKAEAGTANTHMLVTMVPSHAKPYQLLAQGSPTNQLLLSLHALPCVAV
jgi:hypothetical protein